MVNPFDGVGWLILCLGSGGGGSDPVDAGREILTCIEPLESQLKAKVADLELVSGSKAPRLNPPAINPRTVSTVQVADDDRVFD